MKLENTNKGGPIIVIEDDREDQEILAEIFDELNYKNKIVYFSDGEDALKYLVATDIKPFLILSDINMPRLSGFELREKINVNENLNMKCIPYLFFTTTSSKAAVINAYSKSAQGFFVKPNSYEKLKNTISKIVEYWQECEAPDFTPD